MSVIIINDAINTNKTIKIQCFIQVQHDVKNLLAYINEIKKCFITVLVLKALLIFRAEVWFVAKREFSGTNRRVAIQQARLLGVQGSMDVHQEEVGLHCCHNYC